MERRGPPASGAPGPRAPGRSFHAGPFDHDTGEANDDAPDRVVMTRSYGWIIVGAGIAMTCVGMGSMLSLSVFLQPMSEAMGWSRTGISTAALLNWLSMGVGSFAWGAISDRFGTRTVVLAGGVLLGIG